MRERIRGLVGKQLIATVGILSVALFAAKLGVSASASTYPAISAKPDPRRLRTGHFVYRSIDNGKTVGKGQISIRRLESGNYEFLGQFDFEADFKGYPTQRWSSVATSDFTPISASLTVIHATVATPVFGLEYNRSQVTGSFHRKNYDAKATKSVDAALPPYTYDQRIDWAVVLASVVETSQEFGFNVYDPGTGVSRVLAEVGPLERIEVPAGSFDAYRVVYRIEKAKATEKYTVFASRDLPRVSLREEFPNGSVDELIEVSGNVDGS